MNHPTPGKVRVPQVRQPRVSGPTPMCANGVDDARHDGGEDDVPVEGAPLGNGPRHDCCASGGKCAL